MRIEVIKSKYETGRDSYKVEVSEDEYMEILNKKLEEHNCTENEISQNVSINMWKQCSYNGYTYGSTPQQWIEYMIVNFRKDVE